MLQIEPQAIRIPAHSKRQAMDWSLLLLSQGIESIIDHSDESGWGLVISSNEHQRALRLIKQYRLENLRWPWRRKIRQKVLFDWGGLAWAALIVLIYKLDVDGANLRGKGLMDSAAVTRGEWWRLFTAMFLHADAGHLMANAGFGLVLLGLAMGVYGTGVGLLAALLAGAGGNAAAWLIDPGHRSLGASGMVMGCLGLLAAQAIYTGHARPHALKSVIGGMAAGLMLFLLLGSSPGTDLTAHAGGFLTGGLLGGILTVSPRVAQSAIANIVAGALFSLIAVLTWWLALNAGI
jgi:rhomboid protease GluP